MTSRVKMKPALVYSPDYFLSLGFSHVFPGEKYQLVFEGLREKKLLDKFDLLTPEPASLEMMAQAHSLKYLDSFLNLEQNEMTMYSELPLNKPIVQAFLLFTGGTVLAASEALKRGAGVNLGGGFHHAGQNRAEGFCYINDLAVAIRHWQAQKLIRKAMVIDCDLHQGNGTAKIFKGDKSVFTFSIHQENNYPPKEESSLDVGLADFTRDDEYLGHLRRVIPRILDSFAPELVLYQAGADPYEEDQLGQLCITKEGLEARDRIVYAECHKRQIPWVVTLGGGYAGEVSDTVDIHRITIEAVLDYF